MALPLCIHGIPLSYLPSLPPQPQPILCPVTEEVGRVEDRGEWSHRMHAIQGPANDQLRYVTMHVVNVVMCHVFPQVFPVMICYGITQI